MSLALSCAVSTLSAYLPSVFSSTTSPALSIASLALSLFPDNKDFALSSRPISLASPHREIPPRRRGRATAHITRQLPAWTCRRAEKSFTDQYGRDGWCR